MRVKEINFSVTNEQIIDSQKRIVEIESWQDYCQEIINKESVYRKDIEGDVDGYTLPKSLKSLEIYNKDIENATKLVLRVKYGVNSELEVLKLCILLEEK